MNKKILPYVLLASIGISQAYAANDSDIISIRGGDSAKIKKTEKTASKTDKTSKEKKVIKVNALSDKEKSQIPVIESTATYKEIGRFEKDSDSGNIDDICRKIESVTGKGIETIRFGNFSTSSLEKNVLYTLYVDKDNNELHFRPEKDMNKDISYYIGNAPNIKKSTEPAKVAVSTETAKGVAKSTETVTKFRDDITIGAAVMDYNYGAKAAIRLWGKIWATAGIFNRKYSDIIDETEKTGSKVNGYGKTVINKNGQIITYGADLYVPLKKNVLDAILGFENCKETITGKKTVEEYLMDKKGKILASNRDSYNINDIKETSGAKIGLRIHYGKFNSEVYATTDGRTGCSMGLAFGGNHTYKKGNPTPKIPQKKESKK